MNELTETFGSLNVRIFNIKGEVFFSVLDACKALEISNSRMATSRLEKDDVRITDAIDSMGRVQKLTIINEGALYQLIFRSKKDSAKKFQRWVTHKVLPSIRRHEAERIASKQIRRTLTDKIVESGEDDRMHNRGYSNYTRLTYSICGIIKPKGFKGNFRDTLATEQLKNVELVESMIGSLLETGREYGEIKDYLAPLFTKQIGVNNG